MYSNTPEQRIVAYVAAMLDRLAYSRRPDIKSVELGQWDYSKKPKWIVLLTVPNAVFTAAMRENKARHARISRPMVQTRNLSK